MCGHGTKAQGLVLGLNGSGWWLDMVILKVFSNLGDSVTSLLVCVKSSELGVSCTDCGRMH